jgi:hypothetical protein
MRVLRQENAMRAGNSSTHDTDRETDLDWGDRNDVGIIDIHRMNSGASVAAWLQKNCTMQKRLKHEKAKMAAFLIHSTALPQPSTSEYRIFRCETMRNADEAVYTPPSQGRRERRVKGSRDFQEFS